METPSTGLGEATIRPWLASSEQELSRSLDESRDLAPEMGVFCC